MIKLNIEAYDCTGKYHEHAEKYITDRIDLYQELKETLYILHELEPMNPMREWTRDIWTSDGATFTYAKVEATIVNIYENSKYEYTVEVRDI